MGLAGGISVARAAGEGIVHISAVAAGVAVLLDARCSSGSAVGDAAVLSAVMRVEVEPV